MEELRISKLNVNSSSNIRHVEGKQKEIVITYAVVSQGIYYVLTRTSLVMDYKANISEASKYPWLPKQFTKILNVINYKRRGMVAQK